MISIPAALIEFVEDGNTIWVHGPMGATILRLKTMGKIKVNGECENICSHSDMIVQNDIEICLSDDAKSVTDLDRMKDTFDKIGVHYVEKLEGEYTYLYMATEEEQKAGEKNTRCLTMEIFFEFQNGKLSSHP